MLHLYIGDGKGKTTAAFGLALRACGWGKRIYVCQMLKDCQGFYGESMAIKQNNIPILVQRFKDQIHPMFSPKNHDLSALKRSSADCLKKIEDIIRSNKYDLIVVDELLNSLACGFISKKAVIFLIKKAKKIELVLTGRTAPKEIVRLADYVSLIKNIKHPFEKKVSARKGIEF